MSSRKPSPFLLTLRVRSASFWASWLLKLTLLRARREQRRTLALQLALDSSLLRQKELQQREQQLLHRQQEMADSRSFRVHPALLSMPEELPDPMVRLLGMMKE